MNMKRVSGRLAACVFVSSVLLVLLFVLIFAPHKTAATDAVVSSYVSVLIEDGDSLWSLAEEYAPEQIKLNDYIRSVRSINHLWDDNIVAGQYIVLPVYSVPGA